MTDLKKPNPRGIYDDVICVSRRLAMTRYEAHRRAARYRRVLIRKMRAGLCPLCGYWHISRSFP